ESLGAGTPVAGDETASQFTLDIAGQSASELTPGPVEGLRAADAAVGVGVEVETDKEGLRRLVGDASPLFEIDIGVAPAGQIDADPFAQEYFLDPFGEIEGEVFLDEPEADRAGIPPTVARIEDDPVECLAALQRSRSEPSGEDSQGEEEKETTHHPSG